MAAMVWSSSPRVSRSMLSLLTHTGPHKSAGCRPAICRLQYQPRTPVRLQVTAASAHIHDPYVSCDHRPGPHYPPETAAADLRFTGHKTVDRAEATSVAGWVPPERVDNQPASACLGRNMRRSPLGPS